MSVRTKVLGLVDVMMRVPPIMVIDEILKIGMGLPTRLYPDKDKASASIDPPTESPPESSNQNPLASIKEFFGLGSGDGLAQMSSAASAQSALEQTIENASRSAKSHGMLSSVFNTVMDELSQDQTLADVLSITTVKFVICLFGESSTRVT